MSSPQPPKKYGEGTQSLYRPDTFMIKTGEKLIRYAWSEVYEIKPGPPKSVPSSSTPPNQTQPETNKMYIIQHKRIYCAADTISVSL